MATITEQLKIDKSVLEENVITATTKNNDVFDMLLPFIEETAEEICENVLGEVGMAALDSDVKLLSLTQRVICRKAFGENISSLDLVLTATGFGIVSTQDTAPASKQRVAALKTQVERQYLESNDKLLVYLSTISDWGHSSVSVKCIPSILFLYSDFCSYCYYDTTHSSQNGFFNTTTITTVVDRYLIEGRPTMKEFLYAQSGFKEIDLLLSRFFGPLFVHSILSHLRLHDYTINQEICIEMIKVLIGKIFKGQKSLNLYRDTLFDILSFMKLHQEDFPSFFSSSEWKAMNFQDYENTKDSPLFIFNG